MKITIASLAVLALMSGCVSGDLAKNGTSIVPNGSVLPTVALSTADATRVEHSSTLMSLKQFQTGPVWAAIFTGREGAAPLRVLDSQMRIELENFGLTARCYYSANAMLTVKGQVHTLHGMASAVMVTDFSTGVRQAVEGAVMQIARQAEAVLNADGTRTN